MLILKIILLVILTAIPFLASALLNMKERNNIFQNSFTFLYACILRFRFLMRNFYYRMQRSRNARKFLIFILIFSTIVVEFVDLNASRAAAAIVAPTVEEGAEPCAVTEECTSAYFPFVSSVVALYLAFFTSVFLMKYSLADKLLTALKKRKTFVAAGCFIILVAVFSFRWIIISEIGLILLMASCFYPYEKWDEEPKGRKPITSEKNLQVAA